MLESLPFSKPSGGSSHQQRSFEIDRKPVHVVRYIDYHILLTLEDLSFKELCSELYGPDLAYSLDLDGLTSMKDELPGLRTGFVVAPEEIVERLAAITAIVGLANGSLGQRIAKPFFESGEILRASREIVRPYYSRRRATAVALLGDELRRVGVEGRLHASEGAFFLWLWAPALTSGSKTLYRNLKERGVLAIPGDEFFYGLDENAKIGDGKGERDPIFEAHRRQMLRISFSGAESVVERGFRIIAETLAETVAADARRSR